MTGELLHAGLGWPAAALIVAVSFAGSFVTAAFGIGGGAIASRLILAGALAL